MIWSKGIINKLSFLPAKRGTFGKYEGLKPTLATKDNLEEYSDLQILIKVYSLLTIIQLLPRVEVSNIIKLCNK